MLRPAAFLIPLLVPFVCAASPAVIAAGTGLELRLLTPVGSRISHAGDTVEALIIAPVAGNGRTLPLSGAELFGTVSTVQAVGLGLRHTSAELAVHFQTMRFLDGVEVPVDARIEQVETARERVDTGGHVLGIDPAANLSSGFSFVLSTVLIHSELELPAVAIKLLTARSPNPEIYLPSGSELFAELTRDLTVDTADLTSPIPGGISFDEALSVRQTLGRLPLEQAEESPRRPSDLINVVVIGSKPQLEETFRAAGWSGESKRSPLAAYRLFHSMVQRMGYTAAPMARLRLNGAVASVTFQKSLDTLSKRHHVRFWRQGDSDIWLGAATEDIGMTFRRAHLTHAIGGDIDNERAKIINDLWFTGCVHEASLLHRDHLRSIPRRDFPMSTDGDLAVLRLGYCDVTGGMGQVPAVPFRVRAYAALTGAGMDILRANPVTVGVTVTRMVAAHTRNNKPLFNTKPAERVSIIDTSAGELVQR